MGRWSYKAKGINARILEELVIKRIEEILSWNLDSGFV